MNRDAAEKLVDCLLADMRGRRGFRNAYDDVDDDVKQEWRGEWITMVLQAAEAAAGGNP